MPPVAPVSSTFPLTEVTGGSVFGWREPMTLVREHRDRRGEPVQEAAPANRADLTGCEETGGRSALQLVVHSGSIVIGDTEHGAAAAVAGEHDRPRWRLVAHRLRVQSQRPAE